MTETQLTHMAIAAPEAIFMPAVLDQAAECRVPQRSDLNTDFLLMGTTRKLKAP